MITRTFTLLLCITLATFSYGQQMSQPGLAKDAGADLIDRALFFGDPEISGGQISPDGQMISFLKVYRGKRNIWVKKFDEPFAQARPLTADTLRPISGYFWTDDSRFVLFVQDKGGDENYHVYAVNPREAAQKATGVPPARNLTNRDGVRALIYHVSEKNPDLMWVGLNDRDASWHDLYRLRISTGELTLIKENRERLTGFEFDWDDKLRLATRSAPNGSTEILRVDGDETTKIYECTLFETCYPRAFDKRNARVYLISNKGDDQDLTQLYLLDPQTGRTELVEGDPKKKVDLGGVSISSKTREIRYTTYTDEKTRRYFRDKGFEKEFRRLEQQFPDKELSLVSGTKDEQKWLVSVSNDDDPGTVYFYDFKARQPIEQYTPRPALKKEKLAKMKPITYPSSDGLEIPAYLVLPASGAREQLPLIVMPHGGPWARDYFGFNGYAQFLANRGYAVLLPNFRGSTGYGKAFLNAGNKQWGDLMQDDITWGVKHLVKEGIADPQRVGIMGGSYGGYATLAGLAFTPDVYAAGVSIVGPSNLITLLNSIPPYWEAGRKTFTERMGDPDTPEGKAQLERQSPLNAADKIKAPLLVVQGANDPRVKQAESEQIVVAMRDLNRNVAYINAPDEGHGFADPVNNMAMLAYAEQFLAQHLQGQYQASMPAEVEARMLKILVDVDKVELSAAPAEPVRKLPAPTGDLKAGKTPYQVTVKVSGQQMKMKMQREVRADGQQWVVTDQTESAMGQATDVGVWTKGQLQPLSREMTQGPTQMRVQYDASRLHGQMQMGGQARPFDVAKTGDVLSDGPGVDMVIARMPLSPDFDTHVQVFDLLSQQIQTRRLRVTGTEEVSVPAGKFNAYRVQFDATDGGTKTTLWIDTQDRRTVKMESTLPQMGGAVMTSELEK